MVFRWIDWNVDHIAQHGVAPDEVEAIINAASRPYPRKIGDGKYIVWGASPEGDLLQAVYSLDDDGTVFVIHARPLTPSEKRRYRRRRRS